MATVIYERRGNETKMYATAVAYEDGVAQLTTYPSAPDKNVRNETMGLLQSYQSKRVDIPLHRIVRVER